MPTIHWPSQLPRPDFMKLFKKCDPRKLSRTRLLVGLCVMLAFALVIGVGSSTTAPRPPTNTGGSGAGAALPIVVDPAPPPNKVEEPVTTPSTSASTAPLGVAGSQKAKPAPAKSTPVKPAVPAKPKLTSQDQKAIDIVEWWWDVFRLAYTSKEFKGTRLTKAQLHQPEIVIVKKASCEQPGSNLLGPKSHKALTYCNGRLELVPKVFFTITDPGKLKVVASGFLYHTLANTPSKLREGRNNAAVLGCLQGSLAAALLQHGNAITSDQEVWVVIGPVSGGEALHNGFVGTLLSEGRWS